MKMELRHLTDTVTWQSTRY